MRSVANASTALLLRVVVDTLERLDQEDGLFDFSLLPVNWISFNSVISGGCPPSAPL